VVYICRAQDAPQYRYEGEGLSIRRDGMRSGCLRASSKSYVSSAFVLIESKIELVHKTCRSCLLSRVLRDIGVML
jgi:hypothetical protein